MSRDWFLLNVCTVGLALLFALPTNAEQHKFLGAATCASSNCHGSVSPHNASSVMQNEFISWQKKDKHSRAWAVLLESDAKIIGKHLGMAAPEKEALCLGCHATAVPAALQGEKFRLEDGVSCESCHGAAEGWVSSHTGRNATHADNVTKGLRDIVDPAARAKLCVSCHIGDSNNEVNHRLIGAGHPRLSFELDTFSMIQPKHWEVDDDYRKRKSAYVPVRAWLEGQRAVALEYLARMESPTRSRAGAWPELTQFECYACHHNLTDDQWKTRDYHGRPGELRLNLSPVRILEFALAHSAEKVSREIRDARTTLENSYASGDASAHIAALRKLIEHDSPAAIGSVSGAEKEYPGLLRLMLSSGAESRQYSYETAEQIAMGVSAILAAIAPTENRYQNEVNRLYQSLGQPEAFKAEGFSDACQKFLDSVRQ